MNFGSLSKTDELSAPQPRKRFQFRLIIAVVILLLLAGAGFLFLHTPKGEMVWLTPEELFPQPQAEPAAIVRLKSVVVRLSAWLWRRHPPPIKIQFNMLELGPMAAQQAGLADPYSASTNGMRAWILKSRAFSEFQERLKTVPGATNMGSTTLWAISGLQQQFSMRNFIPVTPGSSAFDGFDFDLNPKTAGNRVKIEMGVTLVEMSSNIPPIVETNLFLACEAVIPKGNAVVFASSDGHWLIVSPMPADARGEPIK